MGLDSDQLLLEVRGYVQHSGDLEIPVSYLIPDCSDIFVVACKIMAFIKEVCYLIVLFISLSRGRDNYNPSVGIGLYNSLSLRYLHRIGHRASTEFANNHLFLLFGNTEIIKHN